jgi:hypothetical protein
MATQCSCSHECGTTGDLNGQSRFFPRLDNGSGEGAMRVRLTRKLAERLDGIDQSGYATGEVIDLPRREAELLMAERWAQPFRKASDEVRSSSRPSLPVVVADAATRQRTVEQLRRVREEIQAQQLELHATRRADDRIREDLHDSRAITISGDQRGDRSSS